MGCTCKIDINDYCDDSNYSEGFRRARKNHICCECKRTITSGEKYNIHTIFYDGSVSTFKTCFDCVSVRDAFFCSWQFETIWEDLEEEIKYGSLSESCIVKLTKPARNKVCDMIETQWEDED